ncbi:acyltransferase [Bacillus sp. WLY-B-L8]|uniref:acyltransferase n=1 Tax=Bacillus multifaciens TaxID=3068506 RepID=UPI0027415E53|nr:acyltransferase [Bacillus sp. WLY-B-L8]MDP7977690.1 acyltransferase [Bacillus sp. WLY-B-L8]
MIQINRAIRNLKDFISYLSNPDYPLIELGTDLTDTQVFKNSWIRKEATIQDSIIEENVFIGFRSKIFNTHIDEGCQIASKSIIGKPTGKKVYIGPQTWIGAQAIISDGISIGKGSVIGAGSIVLEDVPPYSIVIGRPAKVLKKREFIKDKKPEFTSFLKHKKKQLLEHTEKEITEILEYNDLINSRKTKQSIKKSLELPPSLSFGEKCFLDATFTIENYASFGDYVIAIGKNITDSKNNAITNGGISLGTNVQIGDFSILEGGGKISIGNETRIGKNVHIVTTSHNYHYLSLPMLFSPVTIGKNVIIGDGAFILGGVTIGDNAIIQPNSYILKNVGPKEIHHGHLTKEEIYL